MKKHTEALGTAPLGPLMVRLSIPGMVGMLVSSLYNIVDTFWVSGLPEGTHAIAALTVRFPLQMIAGSLGMGLTAGVVSLVSRRFGASRLEEVYSAAGNALLLAVALGGGIALVLLPLARPVALLFGATTDILEPSVAYLTTVAFGFPFLLFSMTSNGLYRGSGNTVVPMLLLVVGAILNAALDPLLIYGWGPLALRLRVCSFCIVEPQMMAVFLFQGMGKGGRAMLLTLSRNVLLIVPAVFLLAWRFGVIGVFAAQPVADVLCLALAIPLVVQAFRRYPPGASAAAPQEISA